MVNTVHKIILSDGQFSGTSRQELTDVFDALTESPQKDTLVIHFHGGLVSQKVAEDMADRLSSVYRDAGGFPIFVIWKTGLSETLRNNWREILNEDAFGVLVERAVQFILGKLDQSPGERGLAVELPSRFEVRDEIANKQAVNEIPYAERDSEAADLDEDLTPTELAQIEGLLGADAELVNAAAQLSRPDAPQLNPVLEAELEKAREAEDSSEKGLISTATLVAAGLRIIVRAVNRLAQHRDHGIYTTVVEEVARELKGDLIGGLVWKLMKKDTLDSLGGSGESHGGTALLEEIKRVWENGHKPRIVLVGHSAGAIYVCNLLKATLGKLPAEVRFDVIFLAPACSFQLLDETLEKAGNQIKTFRSFGMKDALELRDAILPPVYLSSLLYCVSGLFEESVDLPLVGMARYHSGIDPFEAGKFPEIKRVLDRVAAFPAPWVWSDNDEGPGLRAASHKHGDFDDDPMTLESVSFLIRAGGHQ